MTDVDIVTRLLETFDCGGFTEEERQTALDAAAEIQRLRRQEESDLAAMRLIQGERARPAMVIKHGDLAMDGGTDTGTPGVVTIRIERNTRGTDSRTLTIYDAITRKPLAHAVLDPSGLIGQCDELMIALSATAYFPTTKQRDKLNRIAETARFIAKQQSNKQE